MEKVKKRSTQPAAEGYTAPRRGMTAEEAAQHVVDMGGRRPRFMMRLPDGTMQPVSNEEYHRNVF